MFEAQALRTPTVPAIIFGFEELTYQDLDTRSKCVAGKLREHGVDTEAHVAICARRSFELVIAMFGVLRAGAAYVPIDPDYPLARKTAMIANSGASVLLVDEPERARADHPDRLILDIRASDSPCGGWHRPRVRSRQLAAIIYTSGSTGQAKGVAIQHKEVVALAAWSPAIIPADAIGGVLASSSICFDLSLLEIFVTLMRGGTAILAENALDLPQLAAADKSGSSPPSRQS